MGDEQVGQVALGPQVEHEPQQLGPDRDVEHADRLVGDDQLRPDHERAGDDDALALAARQLVRVARTRSLRPVGDPPPRAPSNTAGVALGARVPMPLTTERLGDEVVDRLLRVERLVRVLEDQLDPAPVARAASRPTSVRDVDAVERAPAGGLAGELDDDPAGRRLARAGLADEAEDLAAA